MKKTLRYHMYTSLLIIAMITGAIFTLPAISNYMDSKCSQTDRISTDIQYEKDAQVGTSVSSVNLPVLMYHGLIKDPSLQTEYFILPSLFESDLKYIKEHGYTTITAEELIKYVNGKGKLPPKPIMLTFDDGYYNNYFYAYNLLKKYNMRAHISIIGKCTDEYSLVPDNHVPYSHLKWSQLREMQMSGTIEVGNHTYNLHSLNNGRRGIQQRNDESDEMYQEMLTTDLTKLQKEIKANLGVTPLAFTYPYGAYGSYEEECIRKMGFKATFSCNEGSNLIQKGNNACLWNISRYLRDKETPSVDFFEKRGIL